MTTNQDQQGTSQPLTEVGSDPSAQPATAGQQATAAPASGANEGSTNPVPVPADSVQPAPELAQTATPADNPGEDVAAEASVEATGAPPSLSVEDRVTNLEKWVSSFLGYVPNE